MFNFTATEIKLIIGASCLCYSQTPHIICHSTISQAINLSHDIVIKSFIFSNFLLDMVVVEEQKLYMDLVTCRQSRSKYVQQVTYLPTVNVLKIVPCEK